MTLYTRSVVCCGASAPPTPLIQFENGAQLAQQSPVASTVAAAPLVLQTGWSLATLPQPADYSVGYYLMDAAGTLLAQADVPLADYDYLCRTATLDLTEVPPGDYSLKLSLYPWQTVIPVPGTTPADGQPQTLHTLATLTVR